MLYYITLCCAETNDLCWSMLKYWTICRYTTLCYIIHSGLIVIKVHSMSCYSSHSHNIFSISRSFTDLHWGDKMLDATQSNTRCYNKSLHTVINRHISSHRTTLHHTALHHTIPVQVCNRLQSLPLCPCSPCAPEPWCQPLQLSDSALCHDPWSRVKNEEDNIRTSHCDVMQING